MMKHTALRTMLTGYPGEHRKSLYNLQMGSPVDFSDGWFWPFRV